MALDYFSLLFKPEILSDIKDHTNNYAIFKHEEFEETEIILTIVMYSSVGASTYIYFYVHISSLCYVHT